MRHFPLRHLAFVALACATLPRTPALAAEKTFHVGMVSRDWFDTARRSFDGKGPRPLRTVIWYPVAPETQEHPIVIGPPGAPYFLAGDAAAGAPFAPALDKRPVILLSHGTGGSALQVMWLGQSLAAHGYVVAAVNHHGNTGAEPQRVPAAFQLWWERALDLRVVLSRLLEDTELGPHLDAGRVGAAGFSIGGYTVVALAGGATDLARFEAFCRSPERDDNCRLPPEARKSGAEDFDIHASVDPVIRAALARSGDSFRDPRIRLALAIAPAVAHAFTPRSLSEIRIPMEVVVGDADDQAPAGTNAQALAARIPNASIAILPGGIGHYAFLARCSEAGRAQLGALCNDAPRVDRNAVHQDAVSRALQFFSAL